MWGQASLASLRGLLKSDMGSVQKSPADQGEKAGAGLLRREPGIAGAGGWHRVGEMGWALREGLDTSEGKILQVPSEKSHHFLSFVSPGCHMPLPG